MRKVFLFTLALVASVMTISAKDYKNSIGMVAGTGIGVQFKTMVLPNFTIIDEFGYLGCYAAAGNGWSMGYMGAVDNLVLAYQAKGVSGQGIDLDWYAGGQIRGGYVNLGSDAGIVGAGGVVGLEAQMQNAPIAFSFDFRPGYACLLGNTGFGFATLHAFDWSLNLGVRYTF